MNLSKRLYLLVLVLFFSAAPLLAQQSVSSPPSRVSVKFNAKYPDWANKASWQQTADGYSASFTNQGRQTVSRFTPEGRWVGTDVRLRQADLPGITRRYIDENHKGFRYLQGYRYETPKGARYQLDVESDKGRYRLDFDQDGNFVNESPLQD